MESATVYHTGMRMVLILLNRLKEIAFKMAYIG
jgi:hypothetical protein